MKLPDLNARWQAERVDSLYVIIVRVELVALEHQLSENENMFQTGISTEKGWN